MTNRYHHLFFVLIYVGFVSGTVAQETIDSLCPTSLNNTLVSVEVYDGPIADMAILKPNETGETQGDWELAYVYEADRTVNIRCKYTDETDVDINLARKVNQCRYSVMTDKSLVLRCE